MVSRHDGHPSPGGASPGGASPGGPSPANCLTPRSPSSSRRADGSRLDKSATIDLLVVGEQDVQKTGLQRGFSIKLVRPKEPSTDSSEGSYTRGQTMSGAPKYYYSLSNVSMSSMNSLTAADNTLRVPLDPHGSQPYQNVPIHRTESRLPSLETMLQDEELCKMLFKMEDSPILAEFADALRSADIGERFRRLIHLLRKSATSPEHSFAAIAHFDDKRRLVEALVLCIRQELAKHVDMWRYLVDQKKEGNYSPREFQEMMSIPDYEVCIEPWAVISVCLKMLRNFCTSPEIQELLHAHRLADLLVSRRRLWFVAVMQADAAALQQVDISLLPFIEEVQKHLCKSISTFLTNLVTNNPRLQTHCWRLMWPHTYWVLVLLAGKANFDHVCLLLHNHMARWIAPEPEAPAADSGSTRGSTVQNTPTDTPKATNEADSFGTDQGDEAAVARDTFFKWLGDEPGAAEPAPAEPAPAEPGAAKPAPAESGAAEPASKQDSVAAVMSFLRALASIPILRAVESRPAAFPGEARHAPETSAASRASNIANEEWLALFMLKLMAFGNGRGLANMVNYWLATDAEYSPLEDSRTLDLIEPPEQIQKNLQDSPFTSLTYSLSFPPVLYPRPIEAASMLVQMAGLLAQGAPASAERRWHKIPRPYLNNVTVQEATKWWATGVLSLTDRLAKRHNTDLPRVRAAFAKVAVEDALRPTTPHLLEPSVRLLIALLAAEESRDQCTIEQGELLADCALAFLFDSSKLLHDHLRWTKSAEAMDKTSAAAPTRNTASEPYMQLMDWCANKSVLLLVANLVSWRPQKLGPRIRQNGGEEVVRCFMVLQDRDPAASETATLVLKLLGTLG